MVINVDYLVRSKSSDDDIIHEGPGISKELQNAYNNDVIPEVTSRDDNIIDDPNKKNTQHP